MRRVHAWVVAAALAAAQGCGDGPCGIATNTLSGSIGETLDLEVDRVRVRKVDMETIAVEFMHGNDFAAKIITDVRAFAKGVEIPLSDGSVRRITSPETMFPTSIERGTITFDSELTPGAICSGCFNVLFNEKDGGQRTLEGAFSATLEDVSI